MAKVSTLTFFSLVLCSALVRGGDESRAPSRKEFKQSNIYPFVFEPVSYLATGGPQPLRFGAPQVDCSHHDAPAPPKPVEKKTEHPPAAKAEPATTESTTAQVKSAPVVEERSEEHTSE